MKWLMLDSSCPRMVVALCVDGQLVACRYSTETKEHSELLSVLVNEVLTEANLELAELTGVAVGKGPGSFIGSRIAMAYAKGICVALKIPLIGVGTLVSFAHEPGLLPGRRLALIDARRQEFYAQHFKCAVSGEIAVEDAAHLVSADSLPELIQGSDCVVGTLSMQGPSAQGMLGAFLARLKELPDGTDETDSLVPDYVRDPDAKPMPSV